MHTISFYSYKGGVGRSTAVYYFAKELAWMGKKVVVADFDFEAPGMPYKLKVPVNSIHAGMVDFIHQFVMEQRLPDSLATFSCEVPDLGQPGNPVMLLPAGASLSSQYWRKLQEIDWKRLLYQDESQGHELFMEWKLRVEQELKPDFLLIDSRTGVTDLTKVTLNLLADQVLVFAADNDENLAGARMILANLADNPLPPHVKRRPIRHFVLTRVPPFSDQHARQSRKSYLNESLAILRQGRNLASGPLVASQDLIRSDDRLLMRPDLLSSTNRNLHTIAEEDHLRAFLNIIPSTFLIQEFENHSAPLHGMFDRQASAKAYFFAHWLEREFRQEIVRRIQIIFKHGDEDKPILLNDLGTTPIQLVYNLDALELLEPTPPHPNIDFALRNSGSCQLTDFGRAFLLVCKAVDQ